jgi:hypothetical protein
MKSLVGKRVSKKVKFMNEDIVINKLSVEEVLALQTESADLKEDNTDGLRVLRKIIRSSVEEANELTDEEFNKLPMAELATLSTEIMKYSGMGDDTKGK